MPATETRESMLDQLRISLGTGSGSTTTRRLQRFLTPGYRREWADLLGGFKAWSDVGCDTVPNRKITRLGEAIERICYARGTGTHGGALISAYYTKQDRAAYLDYYRF
jgi:hypothetical protein